MEQQPKAVEPRSQLVWNLIDALQVIGAIVAAALAGVTEAPVYALLVGSLVRKAWPIVEAMRTAAVKGRTGVMVAMLAMNVGGLGLGGCGALLPPPKGEVLRVVIDDDPDRPGGCVAWIELDGRAVTTKARAAKCGGSADAR